MYIISIYIILNVKSCKNCFLIKKFRPSFSAPFIKTPGIVPYISGDILN